MQKPSVTKAVEYFLPSEIKFDEVCILDANDSFTHNLVQSFLSLGAAVTVIKSHKITIEEFTVIIKKIKYLVLSPGPGIPNNAGIMKLVIKKYIGVIPIFAVCLGMQAINEVLGGITVKAKHPVHGKTSLIYHNEKGIFKNIKSPTKVARYHSLKVSKVNKSIEIQSEIDDVIMAFRSDKLKFAAVQFHPESFMTEAGLNILRNFIEGCY